MKWIIIYMLIGALITTFILKLIIDDENSSKELTGYFKKSAMAVMVACCFMTAFWPFILICALNRTGKK